MARQKYTNKVGNDPKVKVVYKVSPACSVEQKRCRDGTLYTTFTLMSSLPCLHTFWHTVPTY